MLITFSNTLLSFNCDLDLSMIKFSQHLNIIYIDMKNWWLGIAALKKSFSESNVVIKINTKYANGPILNGPILHIQFCHVGRVSKIKLHNSELYQFFQISNMCNQYGIYREIYAHEALETGNP